MTQKNELRIIAGNLKGRKIDFPDLPGLRPTPNRIRETLFNWLAPVIRDSICIDLFAGSGALGIEAISRGAKQVYFVDASSVVTQSIRANLQRLNLTHAEVITATIPEIGNQITTAFDIIFLDPPFNQGLIKTTAIWLEQSRLLKDHTYIYIESEQSLEPLPLPDNWSVIKSKQAGQVRYSLIERRAPLDFHPPS